MRWITLILLGVCTAWTATPRPALAVELALALLNDVSRSMDQSEYSPIKAGYRAAFSDPDVIAAVLGNGDGVAVTYVEFSGRNEIVVVQDWEVLRDAASARAFGDAVANAPRSSAGNTALAAGIAKSAELLLEGDFGTARRVIDVASDLVNDNGRTAGVRDAAVAAGITINALHIISAHLLGTIDERLTYSASKWGAGSIAEFYQRVVIGGAGSFVIEARNYADFGNALKRKLLLEFIVKPDSDGQTPILSAAIAVGE